MNLILVGYMGCGKSSVGKRLANRMGFRFVDLDTHIEEYANASISDIYKSNGEEDFRKLETHVLSKVVNEKDIVLATGGGTPCFSNNMEVLLNNGYVVYLELDAKKLKRRLFKAKSKRPIIEGFEEDDLLEFISNHLEQREPYYKQAHHTLNADRINAKALDDIKNKVLGME